MLLTAYERGAPKVKNKDIIELHGKLAKRVKQYETHLDIFPPTEVLNELRYALRATIEILEISSDTDAAGPDNLAHAQQKTYHALICAYHDLVDGLAIDITVTLDELTKDYLEESITVLGDKRREIIDLLNEVNEKIATSRGKPKDRKDIYDQEIYDNYFDSLLEHKKQIRVYIQDIVQLRFERDKKDKERNEKEKKTQGMNRAAILIGVIGVVVGIIGIVY